MQHTTIRQNITIICKGTLCFMRSFLSDHKPLCDVTHSVSIWFSSRLIGLTPGRLWRCWETTRGPPRVSIFVLWVLKYVLCFLFSLFIETASENLNAWMTLLHFWEDSLVKWADVFYILYFNYAFYSMLSTLISVRYDQCKLIDFHVWLIC